MVDLCLQTWYINITGKAHPAGRVPNRSGDSSFYTASCACVHNYSTRSTRLDQKAKLTKELKEGRNERMPCSFAERINNIKIMLAGIKAEITDLAAWGITAEYIRAMENLYNEVLTLDNEHEAQKAILKSMTAKLNQKMDDLERRFMTAKKIVKIQKPKEAWIGFGFPDQR